MFFDETTYLEDLDINSCKMHYIVKKKYNKEPLYESFFRNKIEKFSNLYKKLFQLKKDIGFQFVTLHSRKKDNFISFFVFWILMLLSFGIAIFTYGSPLSLCCVILSSSVFFFYLQLPDKYIWEITFFFDKDHKTDVEISSLEGFEFFIQELEKR